MKKILSLALALLMVVGMAMPSLVPSVEAANPNTIYPISDDFVLDGKMTTDDEWGDPFAVHMHTSGQEVEFYYAWDDDYCYIAVRWFSAAQTEALLTLRNDEGNHYIGDLGYYGGNTYNAGLTEGDDWKYVEISGANGWEHMFEVRVPWSRYNKTDNTVKLLVEWFTSAGVLASNGETGYNTTLHTLTLSMGDDGETPDETEPDGSIPSATPTPGATNKPGLTPGLTPGKPTVPAIPAPSISSFTDVDEDDWYYEALEYVVEAGLMNGVGEGKFAPTAELDRAMLVTVLWRLAGEPTVNVNTFDDVPRNAWYTSAVNWAAEDGIVKGYAGCFNPTDGITREQVVAILHRFADTMGYKSSDFSNRYYKTSDWAAEDVAWADANGLLDVDVDMDDMTEIATRAEIAALLATFCQTFVD